MEEETPSIYHMVCWLEEQFKNKKSIYIFLLKQKMFILFLFQTIPYAFTLKLIFYNKFPDETS